MKRALLIAGLLGAAIIIEFVLVSVPRKPTITYKDKPLDTWFYGARTNFFHETTRQAAQDAIDALGTNACPFLLANLQAKCGNGALYCKLCRVVPAWLRTRLPYAISKDDLRAITLGHIRKTGGFTRQQKQSLADCVTGFHNPRLRLMGFDVMRAKYETDPSFSPLCRKLLSDVHPGIRLKAAIALAETGIVADPREPRLFPILLAALESKKERERSLDVSGYWFQQQPPGGPGRIRKAFLAGFQLSQEPEEAILRRRVLTAMYRLERHMSQEQKDRFKQNLR